MSPELTAEQLAEIHDETEKDIEMAILVGQKSFEAVIKTFKGLGDHTFTADEVAEIVGALSERWPVEMRASAQRAGLL